MVLITAALIRCVVYFGVVWVSCVKGMGCLIGRSFMGLVSVC